MLHPKTGARPLAVVLCADPGVPLDGPSGAGAHLRGVARGLRDLGYRVVPAVLNRCDHRGTVPDAWDGEVLCLAPTPRRGFGRLREAVERWDGARLQRAVAARLGPADVVWERMSLGGPGGASLGRVHVLEVNTLFSHEREVLRSAALVRHIEGRTLSRAGRVVTASPWLAEHGRAHHTDVRCLPHGSGLPPGVRRPATATHTAVIGWHGHPRAWHGLDLLVALAAARPAWRVVAVGAQGLNLPGVTVLPSLHGQALADQLAAFDVLVSPHDPDRPWLAPLKLADARAQGLRTVSIGAATLDVWLDALAATLAQPAPAPAPRPWSHVVSEALTPPHVPAS